MKFTVTVVNPEDTQYRKTIQVDADFLRGAPPGIVEFTDDDLSTAVAALNEAGDFKFAEELVRNHNFSRLLGHFLEAQAVK